MAGFSQQDIRSRASQKSQYVLITDNGDERTSKVTDARIVRALYEIADNGYVTLFMAVNTTEYLEENDGTDSDAKWLPDEWGYSDSADGELTKLSALLWQNYENLPGVDFFINEVISAMKQLKESGAFGPQSHDVTCFVSMSDDDEAVNIEDYSAVQLNSPELAAAFLSRDR